MESYYTSERNSQILISLMKAHGISKIIVSPGATNVCFVGSIQNDPYFQLYSCVDERSAAYLACGLAKESGEPVVLSCTGATASRNYVSGLTEAFYSKIPILAITATQHTGRIGQHIPQVIDRRTQIKDTVMLSVDIPTIHCEEDEWATTVLLNSALLELRHHGGGPVHINLATAYSDDFSVKNLPEARAIYRVSYPDIKPEIPKGRVGIFVGAHTKWSSALTEAVDKFCEKYNGAVLCDRTSNYCGKYRIFPNLISSQKQYISPCDTMDMMVHIGDISGSYSSFHPKQVWRVNPDGVVRDTFRKLKYVFEMEELDFCNYYNAQETTGNNTQYFDDWTKECNKINALIPELPFSNIWIAQQTLPRLPENSILHLAILNSLRSWNFFDGNPSVLGYSNTGGFGIDGCTSSLIGASLAQPDKLFFGIIGDLAFFYDLNVLGNRHVAKNVRIMLVNNGRGTEFRNYSHKAAKFGEDADAYMAAAGHFGKQSRDLVYHLAKDLGFEYLTACDKESYLEQIDRFVSDKKSDRPMVFEVFTDSTLESNALQSMHNLEVSAKGTIKNVVKEILGDKGMQNLKKITGW